MGYLFVTLIYLRRKAPRVAIAGCFFGLSYGTSLGLGRIVQGAHFPLDVIWSLGIILIVSLGCNDLLARASKRGIKKVPSLFFNRSMPYGILTVAAILIVFAFATRRPYYNTYHVPLKLKNDTRELVIQANVDFSRTQIFFTDETASWMNLNAQGFGLPNISHAWKGKRIYMGNKYIINNTIVTKGYYAELNHSLALYLPESLKDTVHVTVEKQND